ncbi:MAG: TIR domain-containing protein, partial [Holophagales bacterium]|nr:TIR domain-containing protein [Holophagales bacterium]
MQRLGVGESGDCTVNQFSISEEYAYDIALSFAGEDREIAKALAVALRERNVEVFYDEFEQADLWGKDLVEHLDSVYRSRSRFCLMLISAAYAKKNWTTHERRSALARALESEQEYLLPIRLDDTKILGIKPTVGYVDARQKGLREIVSLVIQKLFGGDGVLDER